METGIPNKRRAQIKDIVIDILERAQINSLPVKLSKILSIHSIGCLSFEKAEKTGLNLDYTQNGHTVLLSNQKYMILYNSEQTPQRIRWTISHELGHIMLNHFRGVCADTNKEAAANYFARELLLPLAVLDRLGARSAEEIAELCNVSLEAAQIMTEAFKRRDEFNAKYGDTKHDLMFLACFYKMFDCEFAEEIS